MKFRPIGARADFEYERGLTVLEAAITALVVATIIAISIPVATRTLNAYRANSSAMQVAESLSAARQLAMTRNSDTTMVFNSASGQYGYDFNGDGVPDSSDPSNPSIGYPVLSLPGSASIIYPNGNNITVTFNSRGELPIGTVIPTGQQGLRIQITTNAGTTASVWVNIRGKVWTTTP